MADLLIRGGTVIDGTGSEPRVADVQIDAGRITAVEPGLPDADEVIDARDRLVTPGFVDPQRPGSQRHPKRLVSRPTSGSRPAGWFPCRALFAHRSDQVARAA